MGWNDGAITMKPAARGRILERGLRALDRWPRRAFAALLGLCAAAVATLALWPFDLQAPCTLCRNGAEIVPGVPGFAFPRDGLVLDPGAGPELSRRLAGAKGFTVVALARSDGLLQRGPARIASLSRGPSARNFTIGQERTRLVLRVRTPLTGVNGAAPATEAAFAMWPGETRLLAATYDGAAFRIHVDGALLAEHRLAAGGFGGWDPDATLLFGNETSGDRPWHGHLHDLAVYDRALDAAEVRALPKDDLAGGGGGRDPVYHLASRCPTGAARETSEGLRVGHCLIPAEYRNDHGWKTLAAGRRQASDYLFNFLLWLPPGALAAAAAGWRRRRLALLLAAGAALAAGLEIGQAGLFSRTSSLHDLLAALAGLAAGAAGAAGAAAAMRRGAR
jgi:hypothetical protein